MSLRFDIKKIVKFKGNGTYNPPKKDVTDNKEEIEALKNQEEVTNGNN